MKKELYANLQAERTVMASMLVIGLPPGSYIKNEQAICVISISFFDIGWVPFL
jgi:hypothetical protein